ncbi:hypothetical protein [Armatimonas sp.]|uniref:hypothetical protein n=1 Tax=Armatimonas sp. TaxID=1872638 RepID=UPI00286C6EFF|nr:hypothetical protein [Armatimonas sp.]
MTEAALASSASRGDDAATFWSAERHSYGPAEDATEEQLPVILLMVWVDARESERA